MNLQAETSIAFKKTLDSTFDETVNKVQKTFLDAGFGVVTEIDMDKKIMAKVEGASLKPYKILGLCNPAIAYEAIQADEDIGLFLPCKVVIKAIDDETTEVVAINPEYMISMLKNPKLSAMSAKVRISFQKAVESLS